MSSLTREEQMTAYARLTREIRTMHHTERAILDFAPNLQDILLAVHEGRDQDALDLTAHMHTQRGGEWRAKLG